MNIINIVDVNDPRLDQYYRQNEKELFLAYNDKNGFFIAESELVINRALDEGYVPVSFLIKDNDLDKYQYIFDRCNDDITIYQVSEDIFNQLKGYILIKGILSVFERKNDLTIKEVCNNAKRIVVLEEVENPTNVGAIFRNAVGLFADGILLTNESSDPLYRRSIRVSMGNVFKSKWAYVDVDTYIDELHELGYKTVALALRDNYVEIDDEKLNSEEKLAIILGSEGYGLRKENIDKCDYVCKISMNPDVDSLNAASASGIALWQLCKKNRILFTSSN